MTIGHFILLRPDSNQADEKQIILSIVPTLVLVISKIMYEGKIVNLINLDVLSRRRAPLRAARASGRRGVNRCTILASRDEEIFMDKK